MKMHITPEQFRFMVEDITAELIQYLVENEQYEIPAAINTIYSSDIVLSVVQKQDFTSKVLVIFVNTLCTNSKGAN